MNSRWPPESSQGQIPMRTTSGKRKNTPKRSTPGKKNVTRFSEQKVRSTSGPRTNVQNSEDKPLRKVSFMSSTEQQQKVATIPVKRSDLRQGPSAAFQAILAHRKGHHRGLPSQHTQQPQPLRQVKDTSPLRPEHAVRRHHTGSKNRSVDQFRVTAGQVPPVTITRQKSAGSMSRLSQNKSAQSLHAVRDERPNKEVYYDGGYVKDIQSIKFKATDKGYKELEQSEKEKIDLSNRLNDTLFKLDEVNKQKQDLHEQLMEQVKFVLDMERAIDSGDDIEGLVSDKMRSDFRRETELGENLRSRLQQVEQERLRILERLELLAHGQPETPPPMELQGRVADTEENIQLMKRELDQFLDDIKYNSEWVAKLRDIVLRQEGELFEQERLVADAYQERDRLRQHTLDTQAHVDGRMHALSTELRIMEREHCIRAKMLAMRRLNETCGAALTRKLQEYFKQILNITRAEKAQYDSVWLFKRLFDSHTKRKMSEYLQRWYQNAIRPLHVVKTGVKLPHYYGDIRQKKSSRNSMQEEKLNKHDETMEMKSLLQGALAVWQLFNRRQLTQAFTLWREKLTYKRMGMRKFGRFTFDQQKKRMSLAFHRWLNQVRNENHVIRMEGMLVKMTWDQTLRSLFGGWKNVTQQTKLYRKALLLRTFKNLKVNMSRKRQFKLMTLSVLGNDRQRNLGLMNMCFNAMRFYKERHKVKINQSFIESELGPNIEQIEQVNAQLLATLNAQYKVRLIRALSKCMHKNIASYFYRWREYGQYRTVLLQRDLRRSLLRIHNRHQRKAFDAWRLGRNNNVIMVQIAEVNQLQAHNISLELEGRKTANQILSKNTKNKSAASKQLRKLIYRAFLGNTDHYFGRWKANCLFRADQDAGAALLMKLVRYKTLRFSFDKYRRGVKLTIQDDNNFQRVDQVKMKLYFKTKRRIFNAIHAYALKYQNARVFMKSLLQKQDKKRKRQALSKWNSYYQKHIDAEHRLHQNEIVTRLASSQCYSGNIQDERTQVTKMNAWRKNALNKEGTRCLQKYAEKGLMGSLRFYFTRWHECTDNMVHRERLLSHMRSHLTKYLYGAAFKRWQDYNINKEKAHLKIEIDLKGIQIHESRLMAGIRKNKNEVYMNETKKNITDLQKETAYTNAKTANIVETIIARVDSCIPVKNGRYYLLKWAEWTRRRRRCYAALELAITKTLQKNGFTAIRDMSREVMVQGNKQKDAWRALRIWERLRKRAAVDKWKQSLYENIVFETKMLQTKTLKSNQKFDEKKDKIIKYHGLVQRYRMTQNNIRNLFDWWQQYSYEQKLKKIEIARARERMQGIRAKKAVLKWHHQVLRTQKLRLLQARAFDDNARIRKQLVFNILKQEQQVDRKITSAMYRVMSGLQFQGLQWAFKQMRSCDQLRCRKIRTGMAKGGEKLAHGLEYLVNRRKRQIFRDIGESGNQDFKRYTYLRKMVMHVATTRLRSYWFKWAENARQEEVRLENEKGQGPVSLKLQQLKIDNHNLKAMMREDGVTKHELDAFLLKNTGKNRKLLEKATCRILICQDKDLKVLPAAWDRLRAFARKRQIWRYYMDFVDKKAKRNRYLVAVEDAFNKMKYGDGERRKILEGRTFSTLSKQCVDNVERMHHLADSFDSGEAGIQNYTIQRDTLVEGYVSSQRLALAAIDAGHWRAKHKSIRNMSDNSANTLKQKISEAIESNISRISSLKDQVEQAENDNEFIGLDNQKYRDDAVISMRLSNDMSQAHRDVAERANALSDRSLTMKRLLEDNEALQSQVKMMQETVVQLDVQRRQIFLSAQLSHPVMTHSSQGFSRPESFDRGAAQSTCRTQPQQAQNNEFNGYDSIQAVAGTREEETMPLRESFQRPISHENVYRRGSRDKYSPLRDKVTQKYVHI